MSGGFNNQVVGGLSNLVRPAIQSPDYVSGVSGWSINKDGSAEFNNATFRGTVEIDSLSGALFVYDGTPGVGTLMLAIASQAGLDPYGNAYLSGITTLQTTSAYFTGTHWFRNQTDDEGLIQIGIDGTMLIEQQLSSGSGPLWFLCNDLSSGFKFGNGAPGLYYSEQFALPAQAINTGAGNVQLKGMTLAESNTDYSDVPMNLGTGVWTCPQSGYYTFTLSVAFAAWTSGSQLRIRVARGGIAFLYNASAYSAASVEAYSVSGSKWMNVNDQVTFTVAQGTAGNLNIAPGEGAYISVRREL